MLLFAVLLRTIEMVYLGKSLPVLLGYADL